MRIGISLLGIALCLFLIQASARFGFSRLLTRYALITHSIPVADAAVQLTPSDPEAHRVRAAALKYNQQLPTSAQSLESAVALRYRDDYLWIELGNTREELGDTNGSLAALDQAVHWAPYYSHTHWQRGNLLLRMNRSGEAFADLRQAAIANRRYLPNLIDLAWSLARGDLRTTESLINVSNDSERIALIRYLAGKGKGADVLDQVRLLSTPLTDEKNSELVRLLFVAKSFRAAATLSRGADATTPFLLNGGFEDPLTLNEAGFGWIVASQQKNRLAIDVSEKVEGSKSLQIIFDGNWEPGLPLLSQTVVLDPQATYRLSFAFKTRELVSGGPPLILVRDAANNQLLAKSENLSSTTNSWVTVNVEFTTLATSDAIVVRLERNNCDTAPCPIFGTLWLDQFRIEQTKSTIKQ